MALSMPILENYYTMLCNPNFPYYLQGIFMSVETELSKEEQVLQMMKKVLTDVAKETFTRPGLKHPLSDSTILGIRDCLSLITARERELAEEQGRPMNQRPRFIDEPQTSVVVSLDSLKSDNKED